MQKNIAGRIANAHGAIQAALGLCKTSKKSPLIQAELKKATTEINDTIIALANSTKSRSLLKTRKSLVAIENTFEGMIQGLSSRELTVPAFRAVCSNLTTNLIPKFVENLSNEVSNLPDEMKAVSEEQDEAPVSGLPEGLPHVRAAIAASSKKSMAEQLADLKRMLRAAPAPAKAKDPEEDESEEERAERLEVEREADSLRRQGVEDVGSLNTLTVLRSKRSALPSRLSRTQAYALVKLPLVPIFVDNFKIADERNLNRCAIKHTIIQGYPFLEDQLILCVSRHEIERASTDKATEDRKVVVKKVTGVKSQHSKTEDRLEKLGIEISDKMDELYRVKKKTTPDKLDKVRKVESDVTKILAKADAIRANPAKTIADRIAKLKPIAERRQTELANALAKIKNKKLKSPDPLVVGLKALKERTAKSVAEYEAWVKKPKTSIKAAIAEINEAADALTATVGKDFKLAQKAHDLEATLSALRNDLKKLEDTLESKRVDVREAKKLLKPKVAHVLPLDYALSVLAHINEISSSSYTLVSPDFKVNIRNADVLCFWIMPAQKLNSLFRDAGGKTKVQWSFPWDE